MSTVLTIDETKVKKTKVDFSERSLFISEENAKAMIRILAAEFGLRPQPRFSPKMRNQQIPCFYRPTPLLLPDEASGLLTEGKIVHELAHLLSLEERKPKPHGPDFAHCLARIEQAWFGKLYKEEEISDEEKERTIE